MPEEGFTCLGAVCVGSMRSKYDLSAGEQTQSSARTSICS